MTATIEVNEVFLDEFRTLPSPQQQQVLDFVAFLKFQVAKTLPKIEDDLDDDDDSFLSEAEWEEMDRAYAKFEENPDSWITLEAFKQKNKEKYGV